LMLSKGRQTVICSWGMPKHNNQIKKEAAKAAPIIHSVMCAI
jgi:hypothetical protein